MREMPENWHLAYDLHTHRKYYWNEADGRMQFRHPLDSDAEEDDEESKRLLGKKTLKELHMEKVPDGYTVALCTDTERHYLHNEVTGEVCWMRRASKRQSGTEMRLSV